MDQAQCRVKLNAVINCILTASAAEESTIWVALTSVTNHRPTDTPQVLLGKDSPESELPPGLPAKQRQVGWKLSTRYSLGSRKTWTKLGLCFPICEMALITRLVPRL